MIDPDLKAKLIDYLSLPHVEIVDFIIDQSDSTPPYFSFSARTFNANDQKKLDFEKILNILERYQRGL